MAAINAMAKSIVEARGQKEKAAKAGRNGVNRTLSKVHKLRKMMQLTSKTASKIDRRKKGRTSLTKEKYHVSVIKKDERNKRRFVIRSSN